MRRHSVVPNAPSNKRLERTRHQWASLLRCVGESLKRSVMPLRDMMLVRVSILATCLLFLACSEQLHHTYRNGVVALSSDEARRGWVPQWLPPQAADIRLQYDLDTNERWLRFTLPADERATLRRYLQPMSEKEIMGLRMRSPRSADWWFDGLIQQQPADDPALNAELFAGAGDVVPRRAVIAFEHGTQETFVYMPSE